MAFQDIINKIKGIEPDDLASLKSLVEKYPTLDASAIDKAEYDRVATETQTFKAQVQTWDTWGRENFDYTKNQTKAEIAAREEAAQLREQNAQLTSGLSLTGGIEMTFEEIEAKLKGKYLTSEDLASRAGKPIDQGGLGLATAPDMDGKFRVTEYLFTRITPKTFQFNNEFGRPMSSLEMEQFNAFVASNNDRFKDVDKAYDEFTAPMRAAKTMDTERAKLETERAAFEAEKAAAEHQRTQAPLPTDNGGGAGVPMFQQMTEKPGETSIDKVRGDLPVGTGTYGTRLGQMFKAGELPGINKPN